MTVVACRWGEANSSRFAFEAVIDGICRMAWERLDSTDVRRVAEAYWYFSVQFGENLEIACARHPNDPALAALRNAECAAVRRLPERDPAGRDERLAEAGLVYLDRTRQLDDAVRAASIASYAGGGLSRIFGAMLQAPDWDGDGQRAFRLFLEEHIRFDGEFGVGHGVLSRHLSADDRILPLWTAFRDLLTAAAPKLATVAAVSRRAQRAPKLRLV